MKRLILSCAFLAGGLAGCSYQVATAPTPPPEVLTAYADKVPGKWALLVDASKATAALSAPGLRCDQFDYPLDLSKSFAETAEATFRSVADEIRLSDHALSHSELEAGNYTGVITLRVNGLRAEVKVSGVLNPEADATTDIDASILVTRAGTRMVDSSQSGKGEGQREAGLACGGAADAVATASGTAIEDVMEKLAEQFANSHAVRYSPPGLSPSQQ